MRRTRRYVLRGAGLAALGTTAAVASTSAASASPAPGKPNWRIAEVTAVRDGAVQVRDAGGWLAVEGFPTGWQVLVGDNVAVAPSVAGAGTVARPLERWTTVVAAPGALKAGQALNGTDGPVVDGATVVEPALAARLSAGVAAQRELRVAVAERGAPDGLERILAIREA